MSETESPGAAPRRVIINACLTGMAASKDRNPHLPVTPEEIVADALVCAEAGASIVHLHARDRDGMPTWRKEVFQSIIEGIRSEKPELLVSVTTSGRYWTEFDKRSECLELTGDAKPDMASLTVGSMNFLHDQSINHPKTIEMLAAKMRDNGIRPEFEIFEAGMMHQACVLMNMGTAPKENPYFNFFFGNAGTAPLSAATIASFVSFAPSGAVCAFAGIGKAQLPATMAGIALGGHVRVGLEDNLYLDSARRLPATNAALVRRAAEMVRLSGAEPATPEEARMRLAMNRAWAS